MGGRIDSMEKNMDWLSTLLDCQFFKFCTLHDEIKQNLYCIDCELVFCRDCRPAHQHHRHLQIFRYIYREVVRLYDLQKHLDCSKIQTYKTNGEIAVHLKRFVSKDMSKLSTKPKSGSSCEACGRCLQDSPNCFCSVACKLYVVGVKAQENQSGSELTTSTHSVQQIGGGGGGDDNNNNNNTSESLLNTSEMQSSISMAESKEEAKVCSSNVSLHRKRKRKGIPHRSLSF